MRLTGKNTQGFTLIELLVTLVMVAILAGIAAPSFVGLVRDNRLASQLNLFSTALNLARSEAVKRNARVFVCKRNSAGDGCDNSADWEDGWIVWADQNSNGTFQNSVETVRIFEALANGYTLRVGTAFSDFVRYMPQGDVSGSGSIATPAQRIFRLCASDALALNDPDRSRSLDISFSGRVNLSEGTTACP